jgi:hypothetical protein
LEEKDLTDLSPLQLGLSLHAHQGSMIGVASEVNLLSFVLGDVFIPIGDQTPQGPRRSRK